MLILTAQQPDRGFALQQVVQHLQNVFQFKYCSCLDSHIQHNIPSMEHSNIESVCGFEGLRTKPHAHVKIPVELKIYKLDMCGSS